MRLWGLLWGLIGRLWEFFDAAVSIFVKGPIGLASFSGPGKVIVLVAMVIVFVLYLASGQRFFSPLDKNKWMKYPVGLVGIMAFCILVTDVVELVRPDYNACVVNSLDSSIRGDALAPFLPLGEKARCCFFNPSLKGCLLNPGSPGHWE
jgi:hypothetical protein